MKMTMMMSTMRVLPLVLLLLPITLHVSGFSLVIDTSIAKSRVDYPRRFTSALSALSSNTVIDYEYIPPDKNDKNEGFQTQSSLSTLQSSYPAGIPSGMRGEAVRSALRSGQCIGWQLTDTPLEFGVVSVKGKGCVNFLNNKLTQSFPETFDKVDSKTLFRQACLLTPKGRLIDRLGVAMTEPETAYMFTSNGHFSQDLFQRLDPFIFPLDQVTLKNECSTSSSSSSSAAFIFTLVSTKQEHLQSVMEDQILPFLGTAMKKCKLPSQNQCLTIPLDNNENDKDDKSGPFLLIAPQTTLPECAATGYTFTFINDHDSIGSRCWQFLISDANAVGPVEIGALELETLRIEAGQASYGYEITGADKQEAGGVAATPIELHYTGRQYLDVTKGCYLGQEGIASVLKNPRGPPRTLYSVIFEDDFNIYDDDDDDDDDEYGYEQNESSKPTGVDNLTRVPKPGDALYVLGSNEEIQIGTLRSIAEPGGTGEAVTLGLALVRRADSILKRMKDMDLQIPRSCSSGGSRGPSTTSYDDIMEASSSSGSGIIQPPPLDPLDGLEVIVGGTFTVGRLRMVPSRRLRAGLNMFVDEVPSYISNRDDDDDDDDDGFVNVTRLPMVDGGKDLIEADIAAQARWELEDKQDLQDDDDQEENDKDEAEYKTAMEEAAKAQEAAATAESEAKRKNEKMEMLRKRAEDALAKRKQKKAEQ